MFVELHIVQNFAPSNLNRDDTGSPKDCEFGGYRRARISSQCLKRAVRTAFDQHGLLPPDARAVRTKRLVVEAAELLAARGRPAEEATRAAATALAALGIETDGSRATQYLLFLGKPAIERLAAFCDRHWDALDAASAPAAGEESGGRSRRGKTKKDGSKTGLRGDLRSELMPVLDASRAADIALFGRMVADLANMNVDAACQVAHAISTHRVSMEFDYFTAVDDLNPGEETGAGHLGTVEFNSACYYRYSNVDLTQLTENLAGDEELARRALLAFVRGSVLAVPSGKQSGTAAQNPPSLVMVVVRDHGLWSLANAFLRPVRATEDRSVAAASIQAIDRYWARLVSGYGDGGLRKVAALVVEPDAHLEQLGPSTVATIDDLLDGIVGAVAAAPARS
ncbi:MAG: type I-E CRISPR-associated protein Cas7/Cse4/CasC [Candidatus Rokuibacteriota bacterium]